MLTANFTTRFFVILCVVCTITASERWYSVADEPSKPVPSDPIEQSIRRALDGDSGTASPDEPLLGDVLDLIKQRGSILDGTSLDVDAIASSDSASDENIESRCSAAEALLRAARLLDQVTGKDANRKQLVKAMRREAARCLQPLMKEN